MESAIRFSQNSGAGAGQRFISVDVSNKSFKLCRIKQEPTISSEAVEYDAIAASVKVPPFRAFDWHPHTDFENLVAVGQSSGEATLLKLSSPSDVEHSSVSFSVRSQRPCNAVSLSSNHLLAAGLDRVRTDFCLNIWDFSQRLPTPSTGSISKSSVDPLHKLAPGDTITSLKFFPSSPQHLVAGSRSQFVRLYDLREANTVSNTGLQFSTRCVHNLAIDWQDENYIASCYPNGPDPSICLWDRRMMARLNAMHSSYGTRQPEASLELKNAIDMPGSIWSLRFSKSKRGCLGVLSSSGQLKVYEMGRDMIVEEYRPSKDDEEIWEVQSPQEAFLESSQDVAKASVTSQANASSARVVSFDFTTRQDHNGQPCLITLYSDGQIKLAATSPPPVPTSIHPAGFIMHGNKYIEASLKSGNPQEVSAGLAAIRAKAEPQNARVQAYAQARKDGTAMAGKDSSLDSQAWQADLGYREQTVKVPDLLSFQDTYKLRCQNGYLFDPSVNKSLVEENSWLHGFWEYIERALLLNKSSTLVQDNLDLSYLGVYSIWMEDLPATELATRNKGHSNYPNNSRLQKTIETLVRRLQLPAMKHVATEYHFNRQLCLYISGLSWSKDELKEWTSGLVEQGQHSKAAFLALLSGESNLASRCLLDKKGNKDQRSLALAITGAIKRKPKPVSTQEQAHLDSDSDSGNEPTDDDDEPWLSAINNTLAVTTEPYARAILQYVKTFSWSNVIQTQTALPFKYRMAVAIRHLDDSALTKYISETTSKAVETGDLEGIYLSGIGTTKAFDLLQQYVYRFADLQSSVLALTFTIPRYLNDPTILRKFDAWKKQYRKDIMSWGEDFKYKRTAFDVFGARFAIDNVTGEKLIKPPPPQIRLVCTYCNGGLAHHEQGIKKENRDKPDTGTHDAKASSLTPATAAAIGTVCPHCGRSLPRCGVCDLPLGQEDNTFMKWYGKNDNGRGSVDTTVGERMAGSMGTIVGAEKPGADRDIVKSRTGEAVEDSVEEPYDVDEQQRQSEIERIREQDERMARFTVFCVKCNHGFHYKHARMWFEGDLEGGTEPHKVCPVPECSCSCWEN